jgi:hypothetical protein
MMKQYSIYGLGVIGLFGVYLGVTMKHLERTDRKYPYMNIRAKPFPWGDGDTGLFGKFKHVHGEGHGHGHH